MTAVLPELEAVGSLTRQPKLLNVPAMNPVTSLVTVQRIKLGARPVTVCELVALPATVG